MPLYEQKGVLASTHYKDKAQPKQYALLALNWKPGERIKCQIAHCQLAGHPIAGDKKYGALTDPFKRLGLHAHLLAFKHPMGGRKILITSPLPEVFEKSFSRRNFS